METFKIGPKDEGKRLDQFMQDKKHWPRSLVMKAIRTKKLKVNGKKEDASFRLSRGDDVVSYVLEEKKNTEPVILYEDENLLAAVKPAGLLSLDPEKDTLLTRVNKYLEGKGKAPAIPVHRIDFHTEGILLFAKNRPAADVLEGLIRDRKIGKTYLAVVTGRVQNSKGRLDHQLFKDAKQNKVFVSEERIKGSKTAITEYERMAATGDLTLVKCHLITGRTHQIRTQLAHIGHPILGDMVYGRKKPELGQDSQCLHAKELRFVHPRTGKPVTVSCELPDYFAALLEKLRSGYRRA